jgi:hypothetical protein
MQAKNQKNASSSLKQINKIPNLIFNIRYKF